MNRFNNQSGILQIVIALIITTVLVGGFLFFSGVLNSKKPSSIATVPTSQTNITTKTTSINPTPIPIIYDEGEYEEDDPVDDLSGVSLD